MMFGALFFGRIRENGLLSLISIFAIALSVAAVLAVQMTSHFSLTSFSSTTDETLNSINMQIVGFGRSFDERALVGVRRTPGVTEARPVIEGTITVNQPPGQSTLPLTLHVVGVDLLQPLPRDAEIRNHLPGAFAPRGDAPYPDVLVFGRGAIISKKIADHYHFSIAKSFDANSGVRNVPLRVAAILPPGLTGIDSSVAFVDIATAQELFGKRGELDRIDCIVDSAHFPDVKLRLAAVLPREVQVIQAANSSAQLQQMLLALQQGLRILSYVTLLLAAFLIYNVIAISVVRRRPQIGILRTLGATQGQIVRLFLIEGAALGLVGSLVGYPAAVLLAKFSLAEVTPALRAAAGGQLQSPGFEYDGFAILVKALIIGISLTLLATIAPAISAAGIPPAVAIQRQGLEANEARWSTWFAITGVGFLALGLAIVHFEPSQSFAGYEAGLAFIAGCSFSTPFLIELVGRLSRLPSDRLSTPARLAAAALGTSVGRTGLAVVSLTIAIGTVISVLIFVDTFRTSVLSLTAATLQGDLLVRPRDLLGPSDEARLPSRTVKQIGMLRGIVNFRGIRSVRIAFRGSPVVLEATNLRSAAAHGELQIVNGASSLAMAQPAAEADSAAINETFATRFSVGLGDKIALRTVPSQPSFHIESVYRDYSGDARILIADSAFRRLYNDDTVNALIVYAQPGADLVALDSRILNIATSRPVDVVITQELRRNTIAIFESAFASMYALCIIAGVIALLGVAGALFALVLERRDEIGLLRFVGLSTNAVQAMVLYQAALVGCLAGALGVFLGAFLTFVAAVAIKQQTWGLLLQTRIPYDQLAATCIVVLIVALMAGIYPASVAAHFATSETVDFQ
jgi:putative ABC transport system permease protein